MKKDKGSNIRRLKILMEQKKTSKSAKTQFFKLRHFVRSQKRFISFDSIERVDVFLWKVLLGLDETNTLTRTNLILDFLEPMGKNKIEKIK
mmetsp:Transcript_10001/g.15051  ORF Transcript_10001/g.15051 Transcript_10001/m.15051 type:complete len:91 (-) Transcript_10001:86-358(-)